MRGGKRPGAGRKRGSTRLLPEQKFDLFCLIEKQRTTWTRSRFGQDQIVSMVCNQIAKKLNIRWVDRDGRTVATCNHAGPVLANIYYTVRKQFFDPKRFYAPGWWDEIEWDPNMDPMMWLKFFEGNPAQPKRSTMLIIDRK